MSYLNDIDTEALQSFAGQVLAEPARGKADYAVTSTWNGQTRVTTKTEPFVLGGQVHDRQFQITADEPNSLLGTDRTEPCRTAFRWDELVHTHHLRSQCRASRHHARIREHPDRKIWPWQLTV